MELAHFIQTTLEWIFGLVLIFFIVSPLIDLAVIAVLFRPYLRSREPVLRERILAAGALFVSASIIATLTLNRLLVLGWPDGLVVPLLIVSVLLSSVPGLNWLYMYYTDRF